MGGASIAFAAILISSAAIQEAPFADAVKEARKSGRTVAVLVWAERCPWSAKFRSNSFPELLQATGEMLLWRDFDGSKEIEKRDSLGVKSYPVMVLLDPAGTPKYWIVGYLPKAEAVAEVKRLAAKFQGDDLKQ